MHSHQRFGPALEPFGFEAQRGRLAGGIGHNSGQIASNTVGGCPHLVARTDVQRMRAQKAVGRFEE